MKNLRIKKCCNCWHFNYKSDNYGECLHPKCLENIHISGISFVNRIMLDHPDIKKEWFGRNSVESHFGLRFHEDFSCKHFKFFYWRIYYTIKYKFLELIGRSDLE